MAEGQSRGNPHGTLDSGLKTAGITTRAMDIIGLSCTRNKKPETRNQEFFLNLKP